MFTLKYLNEKHNSVETDEEVSNLYQDFKGHGIKVSFPHNIEDNKRRFIFSSTKTFRFGGSIDDFVSECNGLICLYDSSKENRWSILVNPIRTFRTGVNEKYINRHLEKYTIHRINEGTTINLYYFNKNWRISTNRGFDVTNLIWAKNKTYKNVLQEVLKKYSIDYETFLGSLDKDASYVFGFKHPDFHPFWEGNKEGIYNFWFIQKYKNGVQDMDEHLKNLHISAQSKEENPKNLKTLFKKLANSLNDYIENKNILYGYILKTEHEDISAENRSILLESSLLKNIRRMFYHSSYNKEASEYKFNREKYVITKAFLSGDNYNVFKHLFPQYEEEFEKYNEIYEKLIKELIKIYKKDTTTSSYTPFAVNIAAKLNKKITISEKTLNLEHILSSFILDPIFANIFYNLRWDLSTKE